MRKPTVVKLRQPDYAKRVRSASEAMNTLRMEMYGIHPKDIAEDIGVSVACIYAIRSGRTKWPRPKTFFSLVEMFGLKMLLVKE